MGVQFWNSSMVSWMFGVQSCLFWDDVWICNLEWIWWAFLLTNEWSTLPSKAKTVAASVLLIHVKLCKDASRQQRCFWVSLGCLWRSRFRQARFEYQQKYAKVGVNSECQGKPGKPRKPLLLWFYLCLSEQLRIDDGASYVLPMHSDAQLLGLCQH